MDLPVRHIAKNVIWTPHGTCWGIWRVTAAGHSYAPSAEKRARLKAIEALVKSLVGEPMLLSLCPQIDPTAVVRAMVDELAARGTADPAAHGLARKLAAVARKDLSRVVFDDTLPVVDTRRADAVVFAVHALQLPKQAELASEHRIERLEFEKVLGRAVMYLVAAVARETVMADKDEFGVAVFDECWCLTSSDEGQELLLELIRDCEGRSLHRRSPRG
ncbi:hypothetical protein GCM10010442_66380 [Kitasatospora kifunensis]|uniref:ATP/GTP-binding protein n=1 Tax=Kitasatospora kifunensis TaxID=58351 RepID=A0A7W7RAX6_KITKI|nr:hypothetical protein [Kitasatospora kifunensis]